jgi:hypothetical protein
MRSMTVLWGKFFNIRLPKASIWAANYLNRISD